MDPATIGARLASSVMGPLVRKLFPPDQPGAGLVDRPVRISALVSLHGEKRALAERDLRHLATGLVRRAVDSAPPGERPCPPGEEEAVAEALARTLHALGDLDMDDVQAVRLGAEWLARDLRHAAHRPDDHLSLAATRLYKNLLDTACLHVLHFFTQRSTFVARTLVEQSGQLTELINRIDILIDRVPPQTAADARFEQRYADYLADRYGTLTILGVDLDQTEGSWPLRTAYLSLEAYTQEGPEPEDPADSEDPEGPEDPERVRGCREGRADRGADGAPASDSPLPAEQALVGYERVLLRGQAGSGKTTLVQWLAVSAARQEPPRSMEQLLGRVPFVLPLRTIARHADLPTPERLLSAVRNPLHGAQPDGWADRVLSAGRAILLVDGIDEIPEPDRERTREWLADLLVAYPGNLWLVTSRPSAVAGDWLAGLGFTEFALSPMSRSDTAAFIDRWHDAARATCHTEEDRAALDHYQAALHTAVRTKQDLARLATNPLMCGLICALHRSRRGYLPNGRRALYEAALSMLLARRDIERRVYRPGQDVYLDEEPQVRLLQRIAYYLIRNGQAELDRAQAERIIADALPSVPDAQAIGDAPEILRHLLLRSGLLREPATDTVDFIHRTFQDYLGAKAAVEEGDFGLLIGNAHHTQWEDVVRMAVAHARPRERADVLGRLLRRGAAEPAVRTHLFLLAMACLEHAPDLDPSVREEVTAHADLLIPPADRNAARELAGAGPLVLDLLPPPDRLSDEEAEYCVITASLVGTDAAIPYLSRFRGHPALPARSQLASTWRRFETDRYFTEVVSGLLPDGLYFVAETEEHLRLLQADGGRPMLMLRDRFDGRTLRALPATGLTHLRLDNNPLLTDLGVLDHLGELRSLTLTGCPGVGDLTPLAPLRLHTLDYSPPPPYHQPAHGLDALTTLERLKVSTSEPRLPVTRLPRVHELRLDVYRTWFDLSHVAAAFPGLQQLSVNFRSSPETGRLDLSPLAALDRLRTVSVARAEVTGDGLLPDASIVRHRRPPRRTGFPPIDAAAPQER